MGGGGGARGWAWAPPPRSGSAPPPFPPPSQGRRETPGFPGFPARPGPPALPLSGSPWGGAGPAGEGARAFVREPGPSPRDNIFSRTPLPAGRGCRRGGEEEGLTCPTLPTL